MGLLKLAMKYPESMSRNWEAARNKRGVTDQRPRLGSVALNVAAFLVLVQLLQKDPIPAAEVGAAGGDDQDVSPMGPVD
jgi:hypothetical protein